MRTRLAAVIVLTSLAASLPAQDGEMADVGRGAPRETLAYIVANPATLMSMAGWSDGKFVWMPEAPPMPEMPEGMEMPKDPQQAAMETFLPLIRDASRIDVALIDISTAGPRMYLDITLAENAEVDLAPEFLRNMAAESEGAFTISPVKLHGIEGFRYTADGADLPMFAYVHAGHLYVCISDTAADQLAQGLTRGPIESGSLAELSRFRDWYVSRRGASLEIWFNAYEIRRWVERAEGLLPPDFQSAFAEVDRNLELRTWSQLTFALDYNPEKETASLDIDILSRRKIPLFEKAGFVSKSFEPLARWMPANTVGVVGAQLGDVNGLIDRLAGDFDSFAGMIEQQEQRQRGEGERRMREVQPEEAPPMPGGEDRQEGPADVEENGPFRRMLAELDQQLAEFGTDHKSLFACLTGGILAGVTNKGEGVGYQIMENGTKVVVLGVKDRAKLLDVLVKAVDKMNQQSPPDQPGITKLDLAGVGDAWSMETQGLVMALAEDALVVIFDDQDMTAPLAVAGGLTAGATTTGQAGIRGHLGTLVRSTSTMIFGVDIYDAMKGAEQLEVEQSRKLSTDAEPWFGTPIDNFVGPGFGASLSVSMTESSLNLSVKVSRFRVERMYQLAGSAKGWDSRYNYASQQLGQLYNDVHGKFLNEGAETPASLQAAVDSGKIHVSLLQCPYDPQFEGADKLNWFMPPDMLDSEWFAGDPAVAVVKANAEKKFISYTMVPGANFRGVDSPVIIVYETEANTVGGRMVLYSNGRVGWLHASVWDEAMALTKEGKPIPAPNPFRWDDFPAPGGMPGGDVPDGEMPDGDKPVGEDE